MSPTFCGSNPYFRDEQQAKGSEKMCLRRALRWVTASNPGQVSFYQSQHLTSGGTPDSNPRQEPVKCTSHISQGLSQNDRSEFTFRYVGVWDVDIQVEVLSQAVG